MLSNCNSNAENWTVIKEHILQFDTRFIHNLVLEIIIIFWVYTFFRSDTKNQIGASPNSYRINFKRNYHSSTISWTRCLLLTFSRKYQKQIFCQMGILNISSVAFEKVSFFKYPKFSECEILFEVNVAHLWMHSC